MTEHTKPLQLQCFSHLLRLDSIEFPPPAPVPTTQWVNTKDTWGGARSGAPVKVSGFSLQVPGYPTPLFIQSKERADALHRYITSHLKAASYFAEWEGDLCDWRPGREGGHVIRKDYMRIYKDINTGQQLRATLRAIPAQPYQSSMHFLTTDSSCLCPDCVRRDMVSVVSSMRARIDDGWRVSGFGIHWEADAEAPLTCDNCNRLIEPVYGEGQEVEFPASATIHLTCQSSFSGA